MGVGRSHSGAQDTRQVTGGSQSGGSSAVSGVRGTYQAPHHAEEFIRRFLIHVLPAGFQRIRYYGFLSNRQRAEKLPLCRQLLGMPVIDTEAAPGDQPTDYDYATLYEKRTGSSLRQCPVCRQGRMVVVETLAPIILALVDTS